MGMQHVENLLRRYRGQPVHIRTMFGGSYQGVVVEITGDYVLLGEQTPSEPAEQTFVLLQSIEAVQTNSEAMRSKAAGA